ncbi:MAG TPA: ZIP family metal transporter [Acidobacteriaceae bacterium]|jgi:ZIP family zinc transporter/zinc and cadmium transporter|nr:ZIP family metal transporter [Acidobacteriaceae bacterium]
MILSLILGIVAGFANIFGGMVAVRRSWPHRYLRYFISLGAGFMMAVALLDMLPESLKFSPRWAPALMLGGYCITHFIEHTITPHFHVGEETHSEEFLHRHTGYSVLLGVSLHAVFDGVAIASGFLVSSWLGWLIFIAISLHKIPVGFTVASVTLASGRSRRAAVLSAAALAAATVVGVLAISLLPSWVRIGLPVSAGVTTYVAATDLLPEVNREPGIRMALVFLLGVVVFLLIRLLAPV